MNSRRTLRTPRLLLPAVALLVGCFAAGCGSGGGPSFDPSGELAAFARYRPLAMQAAALPTAPPPPARGSATYNQDRDELLALQLTRNPAGRADFAYWNSGACVRWHEITRALMAKYNMTNNLLAARLFSLVAVAQYDAVIATARAQQQYRRPPASVLEPGLRAVGLVESAPGYPSDHAAIAAASVAVLKYAFPGEAAALEEQMEDHLQTRLWGGMSFRSDLVAGENLGQAVGEAVVARARTDRSDQPWTGTVPVGPGLWTGTMPMMPQWAQVRPWIMTSGSQLRMPPPPAFGSAEFNAALAEVRLYSDTRTPEQLASAQKWAMLMPPGYYSPMVCSLIQRDGLSERQAARVFAYLYTTMMDATISCWDSKYTYWLLRPSQADPLITTPAGLPSFPAYPSAHSFVFSASAEMLAYFFPGEATRLRAEVQEAGISRIYAGLHYRFDDGPAIEWGAKVADLAIARANRDSFR